MAKKNILSESMLILRNPTLVCGGWVLRRCGPCELSLFCSWLTSCLCLLIGSSSRSGPSVYKVAAPSFYPGSFWVGRARGGDTRQITRTSHTTSLSCEAGRGEQAFSWFINEIFVLFYSWPTLWGRWSQSSSFCGLQQKVKQHSFCFLENNGLRHGHCQPQPGQNGGEGDGQNHEVPDFFAKV